MCPASLSTAGPPDPSQALGWPARYQATSRSSQQTKELGESAASLSPFQQLLGWLSPASSQMSSSIGFSQQASL